MVAPSPPKWSHYMVVTIDCKVYKVSLVFATWNRLTKGSSTMITYFLTPEIRGSVIKLYLANNVWLKVPAKGLCVAVHLCSVAFHSTICTELYPISFWYFFLDHWSLPEFCVMMVKYREVDMPWTDLGHRWIQIVFFTQIWRFFLWSFGSLGSSVRWTDSAQHDQVNGRDPIVG